MKKHLFVVLVLMLVLMTLTPLILAAEEKTADWRKTGNDREKIDNLVKVVPGASNIMLEMGDRYKNLYWAAKQGKWQFAEYQIEEMQELMNTLMITRPKRAATAKEFLDTGFSKFPAAIASKDWKKFSAAFAHLRQGCITCHGKNDHAFINLPDVPRKGNSPVID
jgi:hypothetical protein